MRNSSLWILLLTAMMILALGAAWTACGDDDDDDDDDDDSDGEDDDDDDGPGYGEEGQLQGCVHDFITKQGLQDATVVLLDDETGEPLLENCDSGEPIQVTTNTTDGCITLPIPACYEYAYVEGGKRTVGVSVTKDQHLQTLQYHFEDGLTGEEFLIVSESTASIIEFSVQEDLDPTRGNAAGGLYFGDPTDETGIGCQVVTSDPSEGSIHYFGYDDIPNLDRDVDGETNDESGKGVNPSNGYFVSVNEKAGGMVTMSATVNGLTKTTIIPKLPANSVAIANIYYDPNDGAEVEADPEAYQTPDWCTE